MKEKRNCGGCTACCKTHGVAELKKPGGTICPHCDVGSSCKIYAERPESCQVFRCSWLLGLGLDEYRPDKTGVVAEHVETPGLGIVVFLYEVSKGKLGSRFARRQTWLNLIARNAVLHMPTVGPAKLFVPETKWYPDLVFRFADSKQKLKIIRARPEMFLEPAK